MCRWSVGGVGVVGVVRRDGGDSRKRGAVFQEWGVLRAAVLPS